jgi:hypothetical protein
VDVTDLSQVDKNTRKCLFGELIDGLTYEQTTPEWNIEHYTKLLSYTKHSVRRKKIQRDLDWWTEQKEYRDRIKRLREFWKHIEE